MSLIWNEIHACEYPLISPGEEPLYFTRVDQLIDSSYPSRVVFLRDLAAVVEHGIRLVLDGPNTGRYSLQQIRKNDLTAIGAVVEVGLRRLLRRPAGTTTFTSSAGKLVRREADLVLPPPPGSQDKIGTGIDVKFSISNDPMFSGPNINRLCFLVGVDRKNTELQCALAVPRVEQTGAPNQDKKVRLTQIGKRGLHVLTVGTPHKVREGILANLAKNPEMRRRLDRVLTLPTYTERMRAFAKEFPGVAIDQRAVDVICWGAGDPRRRSRADVRRKEPEPVKKLRLTPKVVGRLRKIAGFEQLLSGRDLYVFVSKAQAPEFF